MNELVICLFCFVFRFCITLIQGTRTNIYYLPVFACHYLTLKYFFLEI